MYGQFWFVLRVFGCFLVLVGGRFALRFDFLAKGDNKYDSQIVSECNDYRNDYANIDIPEEMFMNHNLTQDAMQYELKHTDKSTFEANENDSFGDDISSSATWILSLFVSSLLSMIIFSPILIYLKQYFRVLTWKKDKIDETFYFTHNPYNHQTIELIAN